MASPAPTLLTQPARYESTSTATTQRVDPADGKMYTREAFFKHFGGRVGNDDIEAYWASMSAKSAKKNATPAVPPSQPCEQRVDPADGKVYTREAFFKHFGGLISNDEIESYWASMPAKDAKKSATPAVPSSLQSHQNVNPAAAPSQQSEQRVDPADGKVYTRKAFFKHFGGLISNDEIESYWASMPAKDAQKEGTAGATADAKEVGSAAVTNELVMGGGLPKSGLKLYYWPTQGRAQQIRFCLAEAGATWEDVGFDLRGGAQVREDFFAKCRALGGNTTTNVPMLEMDGEFYTQSSAVLRLVARLGGLYPSDEDVEAAYEVDNIIAAADDLRTECNLSMRNLGATEERQKQFQDTIMPNHVGNLQRILGDRGFFVGKTITVADIAVYDVLTTYVRRMLPDALEQFPALKTFCGNMSKRPNIAAYEASEQHKALRAFRAM